jgi:hypothetical protein
MIELIKEDFTSDGGNKYIFTAQHDLDKNEVELHVTRDTATKVFKYESLKPSFIIKESLERSVDLMMELNWDMDQLREHLEVLFEVKKAPKYELHSLHTIMTGGIKYQIKIKHRELRKDYDRGPETIKYFYWFGEENERTGRSWPAVREDNLDEMIWTANNHK